MNIDNMTPAEKNHEISKRTGMWELEPGIHHRKKLPDGGLSYGIYVDGIPLDFTQPEGFTKLVEWLHGQYFTVFLRVTAVELHKDDIHIRVAFPPESLPINDNIRVALIDAFLQAEGGEK